MNFGGLDKQFTDLKKAAVVVLPVPFDKTSTWIKGSSKGPNAIINASLNLELYDIETDSEVFKKGIYTSPPVKESFSTKMIDRVYKKCLDFLYIGKFIVCLGGEHSIAIGAAKAHAEYFKDLSILHLDAHTDSRDEYRGSTYNHACTISRINEFNSKIVSVGIRSMAEKEKQNINFDKVIFAKDIHNSDNWTKIINAHLTENVYITLDLDVLDPGIMPSTGTPEPGGLSWTQLITLIRSIANEKKIVGFDVVELCPNKHNLSPDFLAAKLIYKILSYSI